MSIIVAIVEILAHKGKRAITGLANEKPLIGARL
jgi:hypothetical protein